VRSCIRRRRPALAGSFRKAVVRYPHGTRLDRRPTPGGRLHRRCTMDLTNSRGFTGIPIPAPLEPTSLRSRSRCGVTSGSTRIPLDGPNTPERSSIRKTLHDEYDCPTARQPCMGASGFADSRRPLVAWLTRTRRRGGTSPTPRRARFQVLYQANPCAEAARDLLRARAREWAALLDHDRLIAMRHGLEL
jgi:hypothetical protein